MGFQKQNKPFKIFVNTYKGIYGNLNFSAEIKDLGSGLTKNIDGSFTELILPHKNHSATPDGTIKQGSTVLYVLNNSFADGDRFKVGDYIYYIISSLNNTLNIYGTIKEDITGDLEQVGNTGIYYLEHTERVFGDYEITIYNDDLVPNFQVHKIRVIEDDIEDTHLKLDLVQDDIESVEESRNYLTFA